MRMIINGFCFLVCFFFLGCSGNMAPHAPDPHIPIDAETAVLTAEPGLALCPDEPCELVLDPVTNLWFCLPHSPVSIIDFQAGDSPCQYFAEMMERFDLSEDECLLPLTCSEQTIPECFGCLLFQTERGDFIQVEPSGEGRVVPSGEEWFFWDEAICQPE